MLYPIFLNLENVSCLVVGGGKVAERKVITLLKAKASVYLISPNVTDVLQSFAENGSIKHIAREYSAGDVTDCKLVFALTGKREVNQLVTNEAKANDIWVNVADEPEEGNISLPSIVECGNLQLAISTQGTAPGLARELRLYFEQVFSEEMIPLLNEIQRKRQEILDSSKNDENLKHQLLETELNPLIKNFIQKLP